MTASSESQIPNPATGVLPQGSWRVDPAASELVFRARGMFGLAMVRGTFSDFEGELNVGEDGVHGELRIKAESLDTGNSKRDHHLRSPDFFHVKEHGTFTFELSGVQESSGEATLEGVLKIRQNSLPITAPLEITASGPDRVELRTDVSVDREAAGVGWARLGMIRGPAHLQAKVVLERQG